MTYFTIQQNQSTLYKTEEKYTKLYPRTTHLK